MDQRELVSLLKSVEEDSLLKGVTDFLLTKIDRSFHFKLLDGEASIPQFKPIYEHRLRHLNERGIRNWGIEESIESMSRADGPVRVLHFESRAVRGY